MNIVSPVIEQYLNGLDPITDPVLLEMETYAASLRFPIVGPLVGRVLYQLAMISGARRIFEMGSGFGYSAYWFAKALSPYGKIFCTDASADHARRAQNTFEKNGWTATLQFQVGNALTMIDQVPGEFDIIFNDIDKEDYPQAFHKALPRLRRGGLLISDNVLWGGAVATDDSRASTAGIREYTRLIFSNENLVSSILPIRDGVSITVKLV
ncbi:MAG: O-methyltransferase [Acidobacteria bacterium]|nr:O-methyltransferase [Acidobacteriota bacterium]MBI3655990.1 O-methyltransferase [Acidobacteriota bacterium]